jgi:cytochrome c oxidase assembly protein subunit 15
VSATPASRGARRNPWFARCALLGALCAVPLVLFGGSVTTLGAGMAVDGWLIAEGHFLLFFPVEQWFRDSATFVEHTHRLFGVLVGSCVLAGMVLAWLGDGRRDARLGALAAFLAVAAQGVLGGLRVLENDPRLAFLHGALAQLVFAILCANVVLASSAWQSEPAARRPARGERRALATVALASLALTCAQVVLGAWYRHGLRPAPGPDSALRLSLHALGALLVVAGVAALVRRGAALRAAEGGLPGGLARALGLLPALLLVQLVLGGLAWAGFRPGKLGPAEWVLSIAHVLGGALLLAAQAVAGLWALRLARAMVPVPAAGRAALGEAR